jgi:hypothetical protein
LLNARTGGSEDVPLLITIVASLATAANMRRTLVGFFSFTLLHVAFLSLQVLLAQVF